MTMNSSNKFPRTRSSRPPERQSVRASKSAPFGSLTTRPPTSPVLASPGAKAPNVRSSKAKELAIDEELWFGAAHDHAVAEDAAARSMAALVGRIIGAKPFPMTARRLADLTRQDVVRIEPVIQVLESDPGLSARLLRLVNSAGYALRQRCTSVRHAATLVGTDRLHQIATTAAVLNMFDSKGPIAAQIIEHSTVVGAFCRYLGAHLALPVDDLFTAGFLHDIGKLMLMETESEQYIELLTKCSNKPDTVHHLERALYGFDHAVLAAHVLTAWNIPDPVPKIVAWHHEPTHAYKASSMMAALVQTVRLADALVYVMQGEPELQDIKELAQHESASYLDISEPQLAAMWDELQVLYRESREQCLGENAPALDPRSLRPKKPIATSVMAPANPSERAHELPKQYPCVECARPTYGNTCPACGGYVCPDHQVGRDAWCVLCARDYRAERESTPVPLQAKWIFGVLVTAVVISGIAGMISAGGAGAIRAGVGTLLLGSLVTVLYIVGKEWFIRSKFVRTRPNRFIPEPTLNDGGTQSLVPPEMPQTESEQVQSAGAILKANVRLIQPLKEIAIREISDHDYGLADSPSDAGSKNPKSAQLDADAVDSNRVRLQSNSLVTLPAPAGDSAALEADRRFIDEIDAPPETAPVPPRTQEPEVSKDIRAQTEHANDTGRDTLCGPEFQRPSAEGTLLSSVLVPVANEVAIPEELVVRPMPTIEIAASAALDEKIADTEQSPLVQKRTNPEDSATLSPSISVHPLAALGFISDTPPTVSTRLDDLNQTSTLEAPAGEPQLSTVAVDVRVEPEPASPRPNDANQAQEDDQSKVLSGPTASELDGVLESLAQRSAAQFGEQFQARVSELVAQRVAELVAERMLKAIGTALPSASAPQPHVAGRGKSTATRAGKAEANSGRARKARTPRKPNATSAELESKVK